jgi:hypothetical protein
MAVLLAVVSKLSGNSTKTGESDGISINLGKMENSIYNGCKSFFGGCR